MATMAFQLRAKGPQINFNGQGRIDSRKVFMERQDAENYKETFKKMCCGDGLTDLDPEGTVVDIIELEVHGRLEPSPGWF